MAVVCSNQTDGRFPTDLCGEDAHRVNKAFCEVAGCLRSVDGVIIILNNMKSMNFNYLSETIWEAHNVTYGNAVKQINLNLTIRNWLIGHFIVEYELKGEDRASYGKMLYRSLARSLRNKGIKGLSLTMLHTCKQFYLTYPAIVQSVTEKLQRSGNELKGIFQSLTEKCLEVETVSSKMDRGSLEETIEKDSLPAGILLSRLSFTHFVELTRVDTPLKRAFYEIQTIKNNWSVRTLSREVGAHLFERMGMSMNQGAVLAKANDAMPLSPQDIIKSPYVLDFLGDIAKDFVTESDLENAIVGQLQRFLMELGRGFCFEARQKRIVVDNEHFVIDLVFYHRILKCHVLIDLKMRKFCHADASQMNLYINYFQDNELTDGDNSPIGIIFCTDKNETLVQYATGGMSRDLFVSKYLVELPSVDQLRRMVVEDRIKLEEIFAGKV
jgi:predicted nuclease of restriction endonuclease-like (RecB) superfamily